MYSFNCGIQITPEVAKAIQDGDVIQQLGFEDANRLLKSGRSLRSVTPDNIVEYLGRQTLALIALAKKD